MCTLVLLLAFFELGKHTTQEANPHAYALRWHTCNTHSSDEWAQQTRAVFMRTKETASRTVLCSTLRRWGTPSDQAQQTQGSRGALVRLQRPAQ
jgi:hypothetical protein